MRVTTLSRDHTEAGGGHNDPGGERRRQRIRHALELGLNVLATSAVPPYGSIGAFDSGAAGAVAFDDEQTPPGSGGPPGAGGEQTSAGARGERTGRPGADGSGPADVCRLDAHGVDRVETLLSRLGTALGVGPVSGDAYDRIAELAKRLWEDQRRPVLVLERPEPSVAVALFARLRDEMWELPVTWLVVVSPSSREILDRPPAKAFFEVVLD